MSKASGGESKNTLYCSFCGKSQHEVRKLIAGPTVFICDECVELCMEIIREENKTSFMKSRDGVPIAGEIFKVLDDYVVGQQHAKKVLSVAVHNHYKRINVSGKNADVELAKSNILLIGPTGCGKTLLAQTLARILDVPFTMADATTLTEAGYVGEDVENIILKLLAERRLQCRAGAARNRLHRRSRQDQPQIGQPVDHARRVRRRRPAGAAQDHGRHDRQRSSAGRPQASSAGIPAGRHDEHPLHLRRRVCRPREDHFGRARTAPRWASAPTVRSQDERGTGEVLREVEPEDLLKFGLIPEFIGRLPILATLGDLAEPALIEILTRPKNALAKQYQRMFEMEGVKLRFQEEAMHSIAKTAILRRTGARGLRSIMEGISARDHVRTADFERSSRSGDHVRCRRRKVASALHLLRQRPGARTERVLNGRSLGSARVAATKCGPVSEYLESCPAGAHLICLRVGPRAALNRFRAPIRGMVPKPGAQRARQGEE